MTIEATKTDGGWRITITDVVWVLDQPATWEHPPEYSDHDIIAVVELDEDGEYLDGEAEYLDAAQTFFWEVMA